MPYHATPTERLQAVIAAQRDMMACGLDLQRVMDATTMRARELTSAAASVLELREGDQMVYRSVSGSAEDSLGLRLDVHSSLSGRSVLERKILRCSDSETDERVNRQACRRVGARSMLCIPLLHEGDAVGVLKVYSPEPGFFDDEDVSTLELMVAFISAATSNAVAQRALQSSERRFRAVAELASDGIITADGAGHITFWNLSAARMFGYEEHAVLGRPISVLMPERFALMHRGADGRFDPVKAAQTAGKTIEFTGMREDGAEFPLELSVSTWSANEERFFTAIVRDITERKRLEASVLTLARTDHLTNLLNRRAGEESLQRVFARARRHDQPLSVVLLDVDHFKRINDSAGHAGGDKVLRNLGTLITRRVRSTDVAVRWGGEEFLLVLPELNLAAAIELAESLRRTVAQADCEIQTAVTISCGVATLRVGEHAEQVIARADERLYAAKSSGRNRVES